MTSREIELANEVERLLEKEKIQFARQVAVGGLLPDFLIFSPDNRKFIVDVKAWERFDGFRNRAAHQSNLYKNNLGVDEAFVVVDKLKRSSVAEGVVTVDKLIPAIKDAISRRAPSSGEIKTISKIRKSHVFAAMPFDAKYDDVYFVDMTYAAEKNDAVCIRVDQLEYSGDIVSEIHKQIRRAIAVVADLSESRPNVLYEVGYAHALKKPTVHICSTPIGELPFDVAHWNTIQYGKGQTHLLRDQLANRLNNLIDSSD
jgi:hypothetical protein